MQMFLSAGLARSSSPRWLQRAYVAWCDTCAELFDWTFIVVCLLVSGRLWQALVAALVVPGWLALRWATQALQVTR